MCVSVTSLCEVSLPCLRSPIRTGPLDLALPLPFRNLGKSCLREDEFLFSYLLPACKPSRGPRPAWVSSPSTEQSLPLFRAGVDDVWDEGLQNQGRSPEFHPRPEVFRYKGLQNRGRNPEFHPRPELFYFSIAPSSPSR